MSSLTRLLNESGNVKSSGGVSPPLDFTFPDISQKTIFTG